jgi:hypothetical protein
LQHLAQARAAGWTEQQIADIEAGQFTGLDTGLTAVMAFVGECVDGPDIAKATFAAAHAVLTDRRWRP